MKQATWLMLLAITFWTIDRDQWISTAVGATVTSTNVNTSIVTTLRTMTSAQGQVWTFTSYTTATHTNVTTSTNTDGPHTSTKTGTSTDTNCHAGTSLYQGGQWNYCNRSANNNQDNTQDDTKDLNNQGADKSTMLGMAAIAAGMALVAAGTALLGTPQAPLGIAMIAAGMALIASGMAALAAAGNMNKNANKANTNAFKMDNLNDPYKSTISTDTGKKEDGTSKLGDVKKVDLGEGNNSGIKIDPALLRTGKLDGIFADMEKNTGLNRDDFAKAMSSGGDPLNLLANSPAMKGKAAGNEGSLNKMMDDTMAKGGMPGADEMMNQLGLTDADLNKGNVVDQGGGGSRNPTGAGAPSLDSLFPISGKDQSGASGGDANGMKISPEVQAALDKNGITGRTIFEMVHVQYKKKTPQMLGEQLKKFDGTSDNPYSGLNGSKMEL